MRSQEETAFDSKRIHSPRGKRTYAITLEIGEEAVVCLKQLPARSCASPLHCEQPAEYNTAVADLTACSECRRLRRDDAVIWRVRAMLRSA